MKTLGILGGVGPQTTSKIYLSIIDQIRKSGAGTYPPIVVYNLPFPFAIEDEVIVHGVHAEKMLPYLLDGVKILEKAGADFGILPCNTLHKFINEIRRSVSLPFLSILEETASALKTLQIKNVGILASETTINSKIYEQILSENNINLIYPQQQHQATINNIIVELLRGVISDTHAQHIEAVCHSLQQSGAESILLACTDLQLAISEVQSSIPLIDTTEILINASVQKIASL